MTLVSGMNHVAVLTDDLDRFVEFYTSVFDLDVVFSETAPPGQAADVCRAEAHQLVRAIGTIP